MPNGNLVRTKFEPQDHMKARYTNKKMAGQTDQVTPMYQTQTNFRSAHCTPLKKTKQKQQHRNKKTKRKAPSQIGFI